MTPEIPEKARECRSPQVLLVPPGCSQGYIGFSISWRPLVPGPCMRSYLFLEFTNIKWYHTSLCWFVLVNLTKIGSFSKREPLLRDCPHQRAHGQGCVGISLINVWCGKAHPAGSSASGQVVPNGTRWMSQEAVFFPWFLPLPLVEALHCFHSMADYNQVMEVKWILSFIMVSIIAIKKLSHPFAWITLSHERKPIL